MKNCIKFMGLGALLSLNSFASETVMNSQSVGVNFSTHVNYFRNNSETIDQNLINMTVKVYENGEVFIENFDFTFVNYQESFQDGDYEVDADFFEFYRDQIHRKLGYETGTRYIDLKVARVIKMESIDDVTFKIIGKFELNSHRHVRLIDENPIKDNETHFWDRSYPIAYGIGATAEYDMGDGYLKAEVSHYRNESNFESQNEKTPYEYSRVRNQVEFTYKPNNKKCHNFSVGLRQVDLSQSMATNRDSIKDTELYARYNCDFDLEKFFSGEDDIYGNFIRY